MTELLEKACASIAEEYGLQMDNLAKKEMARVFAEIIASGDLRLLVRQTDIRLSDPTVTGGVRADYRPYRERRRLEDKIKDLELEIHGEDEQKGEG